MSSRIFYKVLHEDTKKVSFHISEYPFLYFTKEIQILIFHEVSLCSPIISCFLIYSQMFNLYNSSLITITVINAFFPSYPIIFNLHAVCGNYSLNTHRKRIHCVKITWQFLLAPSLSLMNQL